MVLDFGSNRSRCLDGSGFECLEQTLEHGCSTSCLTGARDDEEIEEDGDLLWGLSRTSSVEGLLGELVGTREVVVEATEERVGILDFELEETLFVSRNPSLKVQLPFCFRFETVFSRYG